MTARVDAGQLRDVTLHHLEGPPSGQ